MPADDTKKLQNAFLRDLRARHPRLRDAIPADVKITAMYRGERHDFRSKGDLLLAGLRLAWVSDAFLAHLLYRVKARLQGLGVPIIPRIAHHLAIIVGQVAIGDPVVMASGVYLVHGQVVIDGIVEIGPEVVISPFTTIGLRAGDFNGPKLERGVMVGTGARLIGDIRIGAGATIGANAVVVSDVEPGTTVVGVPAKALPRNTP